MKADEEEERKRIYKERVEKELKEQHRRLLEEERRKNKKIVPTNDGGPAWGSLANNQGRPNGGAASAATRQSSLRDIQMEEERQMMAERRQNLEQELLNKRYRISKPKIFKSEPVSPAQQSGAWTRGGATYTSPVTVAPAAFRENVAPTTTAVRTTTGSKNAWSTADVGFKPSLLNISSDSSDDQQRNDTENLFQEDKSRARRKSPLKPMTFENKLHKKPEKSNSSQQSRNSAVRKSQPETTKPSNEAIKRLLTQPNDEFAIWCIEQMKKLNKEIADSEASVFIEFLRNVPDLEVKDYVLGYVPETPATNKFLNDFIERRTRLRISGSTNASLNEWSTVNKQNHGNSDQQQNLQHNNNNNNNNKTVVQSKKKGKKGGGGAVLDHAILGFKATGDPNRVNVGEIDSPM
uniref:Uncharacterized protein n=1 Tax=Romanomermis culicivorax TaxID=13658 RepID=A0A915KTI7_ROMCU